MQKIKADFRDSYVLATNEKDKEICTVGISLATLLINAVKEREKYTRQLADIHRNPHRYESALAQDNEKRKAFLKSNIHRGWEAASAKMIEEIDAKYSYMRSLER